MQVRDFSRGVTCGASRNDACALLLGIGNMSLRKLKKSRARRAKLPRKTRSGN
ncbi:hypothetical protein [Burkholderia multivorans]|uniref:hypothetical protein n=1 Tax=Burkholderia multivorans TaxID=87883 RepID=UPI0015E2BB6C|nr:hypothetical protein [Burkholderia multivorans]MDN8048369.1 hypothetical protein [Burkholderia multivorans]